MEYPLFTVPRTQRSVAIADQAGWKGDNWLAMDCSMVAGTLSTEAPSKTWLGPCGLLQGPAQWSEEECCYTLFF